MRSQPQTLRTTKRKGCPGDNLEKVVGLTGKFQKENAIGTAIVAGQPVKAEENLDLAHYQGNVALVQTTTIGIVIDTGIGTTMKSRIVAAAQKGIGNVIGATDSGSYILWFNFGVSIGLLQHKL